MTVLKPEIPILKDFTVKEFKRSIHSAGCYNYGVRHFLDKDVEHIFILGDQLMILDDDVFINYIKVSEQTNIEFLTYSRDEDDPFGEKNNNRLTVELKEGMQLLLSKGFNGHLMYCRKSVFEKVGFFDERYRSSFESSDFSNVVVIKALLHLSVGLLVLVNQIISYIKKTDLIKFTLQLIQIP